MAERNRFDRIFAYRPPSKRRFHLSPPQTITISFAAMILTGALLLCLPISSTSGQGTPFLDALFTATSANCVTGLVVVPTFSHWTVFGKTVILALIQLGGLGLIAVLTLGMVLLRRRISLQNRLVIQAAFNQDGIGGMVRLVQKVILITLCIEGVGAVLLAAGFYFSSAMPLGRAVGMGVFHSISAFCNAGFDILGPDSLVPYQGNFFINLVINALIIAGGLGFTVWGELLGRQKRRRPLRIRWAHMSLHSKMVLVVTGVLLLAGSGLFLLLEWGNPKTLAPLSVPQKIIAAFFQSVTLRTCGFFTIDQGGLTEASKLISCVWMIIGGSPAGTAGGMKTVTLGVVVVSMVSVLRGRSKIEAFGRTLPLSLLQKALTVAATMLIVVLTSIILLHFTEQGSPFAPTLLDLTFESASAAGTVGLTTGLTPYLSSAGKGIISMCMFLGRLSPVTVAVALNMRLSHGDDSISYPEERVIIG